MAEKLPSIIRPRTDKDSPEVGVNDKLDVFPINEAEYRIKTDFKSYFRLIGVPYRASEKFHVKILNRNIKGALLAVRHHLNKSNRVCVFRHCVNAVERAEGRKIYTHKRKAAKKSSVIPDDLNAASLVFSKRQKIIKRRAESFIETIRKPVYTTEQARVHISALR